MNILNIFISDYHNC